MIGNIVIGVLTFFAYSSIWPIVKHFKFVVPFTDEMIALGVISPSSRWQLLFVDRVSRFLMAIITQLLCFICIHFNPSGIKVYAIVAVITLLLLRPTRDRYTRSRYTIEEYIRSHSVCMNMDRLKELNK